MEPTITAITSLEAALQAQQACNKTVPAVSKLSTKAFTKSPYPITTDSLFYKSKGQDLTTGNSELKLSCLPRSRPPTAMSTLQSNLFQAGFEDCASEVIRFLMQQEKMDNQDPLIQGLQSHLHAMSNTICPENIACVDECSERVTPLCPSSLSDMGNSSSVGNWAKSCSDSSSLQPLQNSSSAMILQKCESESEKSPLSHSTQTSPKRKHSTAFPSQDVESSLSVQCPHVYDTESSSIAAKKNCQRLNHSVTNVKNGTDHPALVSSQPSSRTTDCLTSPIFSNLSPSSSLCVSPFPFMCPFGSALPMPQPSPLSCELSSSSFWSSLVSLSSSSSSSTASSQTHLSSSFSKEPLVSDKNTSSQLQSTTSKLHSSSSISSSSTSSTSSSLSSSLDSHKSVLELKANFLPGIDSSSLASGNFADILLAVESCQSHDNPRVRELADKIIHLIHNDEDEEDEDEEDEDEEEAEATLDADTNIDDDEGNDRHISVLEDSGIDLDEQEHGLDWCNPADMIEL